MESLYTKYRPQTFADVVGQTHVVTTLEHAVLEGRTSHTYLFCGPRGTGKTTMARLLAKALLCEQGAGHLPDGTCEQCKAIAAGEHPDVYELDAASRTGVDNVREEIISRVSFAPSQGAYKMYIIDEVHMLTTAAFNALLKTLEEPPSHVVFVLCTTDPQKIPETILSRVQRFDFHPISNSDIQARLAYICEREGFGYDPEALELVVRHARGGMRDAISELEQLSVSGGGNITVDVARDVLGEVSASTLERMSLSMAKRDVPALFAQVESLVEVGRDLLQFTRALAARLRDVYVVSAIGARSGITTASDDDLPALTREAQAFGSVDRVARALELLSDASTEMRVATNQRLVLEVALTKIARPQSELTLEALADRVATLERQVAALSTPSARKAQADAASATLRATEAGEPAAQAQGHRAAQDTAAPRSAARMGAQQAVSAPQTHVAQAPEGQAAPQASAAQTPSPYAPAPQAQRTEAPTTPQPEKSETRPQAAPMRAAQKPTRPYPAAGRQPEDSKQQAQPMPAQPQGQPSWQAAPRAARSTQPAPAPSTTPTTAAPNKGDLQRGWRQVIDTLLERYPQHGSLLMNSTIVSDDGQHLMVSLPKGSGFAFRMLERRDVRANLDPTVQEVFGNRKAIFVEGGALRAAQQTQSPKPASAVSATRQAAAQPQQTHAPSFESTRVDIPASTGAPQGFAGSSQRNDAPIQQMPGAQNADAPKPAQSTQPMRSTQPRQQSPASNAPGEPAGQANQSAATQTSSWRQDSAEPARGVAQNSPIAQESKAFEPVQAQKPASTATSFVAPWEPEPQDDSFVPYDDFDAAPYEEDYLFGTFEPAAAKPPAAFANQRVEAPAPQTASTQETYQQPAWDQRTKPQQFDAPTAPSAIDQNVQAPVGMGRTQQTGRQPQAIQSPAKQDWPTGSEYKVVPVDTIQSPEPLADVSMQELASGPQKPNQQAERQVKEPNEQPGEPAAQEPSSESSATKSAPKPKRTRKAAGIPADLVALMTEVFGEGVNYISEPPAEEEEVEMEAVSDEGDYGLDDNTYADEPVDDADYDDED